jgi:ArsR family metal-binding transcriptional regulator
MLIETYEIRVQVSTHSAEELEYEAIAHLQVDISPVLPYLNATLSRGIYLPESPVLSWRHEGRNIGFWPDRIAIDHLQSREEVNEQVQRLVMLVNKVWDRRGEIEPDTTTHKRLQPLEILQQLPRTNCKLCGEDTCFNFALKLVAAQTEISRCLPLHEDATWTAQRQRLEAMLATRWPAL